jgi:hypothetical protein
MRLSGWGSHIKKAFRHPRVDEVARHIFQEKIAAHEAEGRTIVYGLSYIK